jgi:hypothetical protein
MRRMGSTALVLLALGSGVGCVGNGFERVEEQPAGIEINQVASGMASKSYASHVSDRYDAPYETVWAAATRVARRIQQMGVEPALRLDPTRGEIVVRENRVIRQGGGDYDPDDLRLEGWIDEFLFQVTALSPDRTKVTVARTVRGIPRFRICAYTLGACSKGYEPEVSNGKIEDWILTQIEDDLAQHR